MLRCLAVAALVYAGGHPDLAAWRPAAFERSLKAFHRDVNAIGATTFGAATVLAPAQPLRALSAQLQTILPNR